MGGNTDIARKEDGATPIDIAREKDHTGIVSLFQLKQQQRQRQRQKHEQKY